METYRIVAELDALTEKVQEMSGRIATLRAELVADEPVLPDWAAKKMADRICLVCGEPVGPDERYLRGCHEAHLRRVTRAIERGEYTEYEAIQKGLVAPKSTGGRKPAPLPLDPRVQQEADEAAAKLRKRASKNP